MEMTRGSSPTNLAANWQFMRGCQLPAACLAVCQSVSLRELQPDGKIWIAIAKCGTGFRFRTGSIRRVRVRMRGDTFDDMWKLGRDFDLPTSLVDWFMCHINTHTHTHKCRLTHTVTHTRTLAWQFEYVYHGERHKMLLFLLLLLAN